MTKCFKHNYKIKLKAVQVVERIKSRRRKNTGDLYEFVYLCGKCKTWHISGMIRTYPVKASNLEMRYHEQLIHNNIIFVKTTHVPLERLTRPIDTLINNTNGWVTIVCKWSSDRRQITEELIDILGS